MSFYHHPRKEYLILLVLLDPDPRIVGSLLKSYSMYGGAIQRKICLIFPQTLRLAQNRHLDTSSIACNRPYIESVPCTDMQVVHFILF